MCPNCILNQVGLQPGLYVAFAVCIIFFIVGLVAMWWAFRNGEFDDIEEVKFDMLDDGESRERGELAKAAVEKLRAKAQG